MAFDTQATPVPTDSLPGVAVEMPGGWRLLPPEPSASPPSETGRRPDITALVFLLLLILFHIVLNIYWLNVDCHIIRWDEAHHIQRAVDFHTALFSTESQGGFARLIAAVGIESPYPPLSHLLGAMAIQFFGDTPDAVALSGCFSLALLLLGIYTLARQGMAPHNALLTAVVASLTPMISGYSRLVMPDTLCGALVVWALYALLKSDFFHRTGWAAFFGLLCGLAFLTKQSALVYLALPAALAWAAGMVAALLSRKEPDGAGVRRHWPKLLLNLGLCTVIVISVCSWWYVNHLEYLYTWWSTQRSHGTGLFQPAFASRLSGALPAVTDTPEARIALDPALSVWGSKISKAPDPVSDASLLAPYGRFWKRYLIYLVNEVTFLPLALVALAGLPALLLKRNRSSLTLLLLAWPIGAYLLLTGLFALHSPRFLYGVAAVPAFFAVLALDAVPFVRLRRVLWGILLVILALQFVNLNLVPFGPLKRLEIPLLGSEPAVKQGGNAGITLYKDIIRSGRYTVHAPCRGKQATEMLLEAMAANESARQEASSPEAAAGPAAWYQEVAPVPSPLGLDFYARRSAHSPGPEGSNPIRPFVPIKAQSYTPEDTLPELADTVYVVVYHPREGDYIKSLEHSLSFFLEQGFESIFTMTIGEDNPDKPGYIHLLAREELPKPEKINGLFDLYEALVRDGRNYLLSEEERTALEKRYTMELERYTHTVQSLDEHASLLGFHVEKTSEDWYLIRLVIHCDKVSSENPLRVWMRAKVQEDDQKNLFEPQLGLSELNWDFDPQPPTNQWTRNQALIFTRIVMARPLHYQVELGLYDPKTEEKPASRVKTEWVDFSSIK